jgi:two-component system, NtrC family, sensor kinase
LTLWNKIKPAFWEHPQDHGHEPLNYRRMWEVNFWVALTITLLPLIVLGLTNLYFIDAQYQLERKEINNRLHRLLSVTSLQMGSFFKERESALSLILQRNSEAELADTGHLSEIFRDLEETFAGFVALALVDDRGRVLASAGDNDLAQGDHSQSKWFSQSLEKGSYIGGARPAQSLHDYFVVALSRKNEAGALYVLRAILDTARLYEMAKSTEVAGGADAFVIDKRGRLITPSTHSAQLARYIDLPALVKHQPLDIVEREDRDGEALLVGVAQVRRTPFVLVMVSRPRLILKNWGAIQIYMMVFLAVSILVLFVAVFRGTVKQVTRLYEADLTRATLLREIVYTNKLASIGRLAAGVAHEINNPTAIINEKVGLMRDLVIHDPAALDNERLLGMTETILASVKRVATITHRLLGFARHLPLNIETLQLGPLIRDVLGFLGSEAQHRNITINQETAPGLPAISSDHSLLEQVFLNIINNALDVLSDGGRVDIRLDQPSPKTVRVRVNDDGPGIPTENLGHIFEPFFTTKGEKGTGLGLSITYGIVHKLGGTISVASELGHGTIFTVILPLSCVPDEARAAELEIGEAAMHAKGSGD